MINEAKIKAHLKDVILTNTNCNALELLESVNINQNNITLIFKMPKNFSNVGIDWENAIKNACKQCTDLPTLISFHLEKKEIKPKINGVKYLVAVASGKGGVGKSSVALSLALAAKKSGLKVGILDADVFAPSLPTLMGISTKPQVSNQKKIIPHQQFGIKAMSVGFLVPNDSAVIWRGLMVQQATNQLLNDIDWTNDGNGLDVLFIDLPPGTGDVQLTLMQKVDVDGAVIISTPHALALADVKRAVKMFEKLNTPILGCIENMKSFVCPCCKHQTNLFANDLVNEFCTTNKINYLGNIAYDLEFSKACEIGAPFALDFPEHQVTQKFDHMFKNIWHNLTNHK